MEREDRRVWIERAVLALVTVLLFADTLGNPYHLDDHYRIVGNSELDRVWPPWRHFFDPSTIATLPTIVQYRPMLPLTLSLTAWASDVLGIDRLLGHHVGNIAIHLVSVLLVQRLVTRLCARAGTRVPPARVGFWAALLFAVHPVAGVPVTYLCARDLLLMQAFLLGSLLVFVRMREHGATPGRWAAALGLLVLSLLSKTDPVMAPALVLAIDVLVFAAPLRSPRTWARAAAFALPVLAFFVHTRFVLRFSDVDQLLVGRAPLEYPLTQAELHVFYYLRNAIWPFHMRPLPEIEPVTTIADPGALVGLLVIACTLAIAWRLRVRAPFASSCIVGYWLGFAATSWVLPFRYLATDYRQYPSLPFLAALVAYAVLSLLPRREAAVLLTLLASYFVGATLVLDRLWSDPAALWGQSVRHGAEPQAHVNYALAIQTGDPELAEAHYHESLRRAPNNVFAIINLGMLEIRQGRLDEGIGRLEHAHAIAPDWPITAEWLDRGCRVAIAAAGATSTAAVQRCRSRSSAMLRP